jgi:hypothetical protein
MVFGKDKFPGLILANELTLRISHLIWSILLEHCQYPGSKMAHHCSHSLLMVLATINHLAIVNGGKLGIPAAAYVTCSISTAIRLANVRDFHQ